VRTVTCAVALVLLAVTSSPADEKTAPPTAWGRPVGKLQLGLRLKTFAPGKDTPTNPLAVAEVAVVLRNLGNTDVQIHRPWVPWHVWGEVHNGVVTNQPAQNLGGFGGTPVQSTLRTRTEQVVGTWPVRRPLPFRERDLVVPYTRLRPGTYQFGVEHFELGVGSGPTEGVKVALGTGYLDVVIPPAP
jgi:hypothetical protein